MVSEGTTGRGRGSRPKHLVIMVADYVPALGGTTTQARLHAREFARRGWKVTIVTRRLGWRSGRCEVDGIPVRRIGPPGRGRVAKVPILLAMWWWLLLRRGQVSAVSVLMEPDLALCAVAAGLGARTALTWVTDGDAARNLIGREGRIRRSALRRSRHVALTERMARELASFGVLGARVIPVPVELTRFRPPQRSQREDARRRLGCGDEPVAVFVGHLQARKAVERLIGAVAVLQMRDFPVRLLLVGGPIEAEDYAYVARLHRLVAQHHLRSLVRFAGPQTDVVPYLRAADVFCLASEREGMPNVLLEAMASGVPCVAPESAGGDAVLHGGAGIVTPSNGTEILATALQRLLSDPSLLDATTRVALSRVRTEHAIGPIVEAYEALFESEPDLCDRLTNVHSQRFSSGAPVARVPA